MLIALAGIGEIAIQQHEPVLAASSDWELAATCSRSGRLPGIESFSDFSALLKNRPEIQVVSLCHPPKPRFQFAIDALNSNRHVMLEKPMGATVTESLVLAALARQKNLCLYGSWHSREALMVEPARTWLLDKNLLRVKITWREDVRRWHGGQEWIWQPGGFGVFDPGINALSIVTRLLAESIHVQSARLEIPQNRQTPIAADLVFTHPHNADMTANFDWREQGDQSWIIDVETEQGSLQLLNGGSRLYIDGVNVEPSHVGLTTEHGFNTDDTLRHEYTMLYQRLAYLVKRREVDVDPTPLKLVADAFLLGERIAVEPFHY